MKTLKGDWKPNIMHLIDISIILLRHDELARIQSAVKGLKSIIFNHKKV